MITIIFAPPGFGKTSFLAHTLNMACFNRERNKKMQQEIAQKKVNGFTKLNAPQHCVSANFDCTFRKFGYSPRHNRTINPYRLGFANKYVKTHFTLPFECIGITEAQKYLNSRMSMYFPDWQSRWYEAHRHNNIDIWLDTQRPMLIDANIRELARFIEIVNLKIKHDKNGKVKSLTWTIRTIENSNLFDTYMASGRKDSTCYVEQIVEAKYNVFELYDSQSCKPKFYDGHFDEDFDYNVSKPVEQTLDDYIEYLKNNDDELPENYYQRRKTS